MWSREDGGKFEGYRRCEGDGRVAKEAKGQSCYLMSGPQVEGIVGLEGRRGFTQ